MRRKKGLNFLSLLSPSVSIVERLLLPSESVGRPKVRVVALLEVLHLLEDAVRGGFQLLEPSTWPSPSDLNKK